MPDNRIRRIDVAYYQWPRERPIRNGRHTWTHVNRAVVTVETASGARGTGHGGASPGEVAILRDYCEVLVGVDANLIAACHATMDDPKMYGRRGHEHYAMSSVDMALWDLKAKEAGMPLHCLLGAAREQVPFYIAGGYYADGKTPEDLQHEFVSYVAEGARAVKIKIGGAPMQEDLARVHAVREAVGDAIAIMVDANCAYNAFDAVRIGARLAEYDIEWFEEPVGPDDYAGYASLTRNLSTPIAAGEQEYGLAGFRDLVLSGEVAVLQPDVRLAGGVSEFLRISAFADAMGRSISSHGDQQLHCALMAVVRNPSLAEYIPKSVDPRMQDFYLEPVATDGEGGLVCSEKPGAGWEVDPSAMSKFKVA